MLVHPHIGPLITAWRERGAIPLYAKILAITMMAISLFLVAQIAQAILWGSLAMILVIISLWIVTRPNQ